jgi:hypothetical protein
MEKMPHFRGGSRVVYDAAVDGKASMGDENLHVGRESVFWADVSR